MFNYILTSLIIPSYISSLVSKKLQNIDDRKLEKRLLEEVSSFNEKFNDTELDCGLFQKFIENKDIVTKIMDYIFGKKSLIEYNEFINCLVEEAEIFINNEKIKIGHSKLNNNILILEYFEGLMSILMSIRFDSLSLSEKCQVSILQNDIANVKNDIICEMKSNGINKYTLDNFLVKEKFEFIKKLVNSNQYDNAEKEIDKIIALDSCNIIKDNEELYYFKGLIEIYFKGNYNIENIISNIRQINNTSNFIAELRYNIACINKDNDMYEIAMKLFRANKVDESEIKLKEIYFYILKDNNYNFLDTLMEDEEIRYEYIENDKAYFYIGIKYLQLNEYNKATKYFDLANKINNNYVYIYNRNISKFISMIYTKDFIILDKIKINELINNLLIELESLKLYFNEVNIDEKIQFWAHYLNLLLYVKPEQVEIKVNELDSKIRINDEIQSILGYSYFILGKKEAKYIYESIWTHNILYTIRYLNILNEYENNEKIKEILRQVDKEDYDEWGIMAILDIEQDLDNAISKENEYSIRYGEKPYFINNIIKIASKLRLYDLVKKYCDKIELLYNDFETNDLVEVTRSLYHIKEFNVAKKILENIYDISEVTIEIYLDILFNENTDESLELFECIINQNVTYNKFPKIILFNRAKMNIKNEEWENALSELKEIYKFEDDHSFSTMYYSLLCMFKLHNFNDFDKFEEFLLKSNLVCGHILVAMCYAKMRKWYKAKKLAFESLYRYENSITKEDIINYVAMNFNNIHQEHDDKINKVSQDCVVIIKSTDGDERKIHFSMSNKLIVEEGEHNHNCENYTCEHDLYYSFLGSGVDDSIIVDDKIYIIEEIMDRNIYYFRYYKDKLESYYPDHDVYKVISSESIEGLLDEMKKHMLPIRKRTEKLLNYYNFGIDTGIPISLLSDSELSNYREVILFLLYNSEQKYYSSKIKLKLKEPYILSLSSIIVLQLIGRLESIPRDISNKVYITKNIKEYIKNKINSMNSSGKSEVGSMYLDEFNEPIFIERSEADRKDELEFWKNILVNINKFKILDIKKTKNKIYKELKSIVNRIDIECIELAKKLNGTLIIDDLFISKLYQTIYPQSVSANSAYFLLKDCDMEIKDKIDVIYTLSKFKYLCCADEETLYEIIKNFDKQDLGYWYKYSKVNCIFKNIFTKDVKDEYSQVYINLCNKISDNYNHIRILDVLLN